MGLRRVAWVTCPLWAGQCLKGWAVLTGWSGSRVHCHLDSPSRVSGLGRGSSSEEIRGMKGGCTQNTQVAVLGGQRVLQVRCVYR